MITITNVTKTFDDITALDNISMHAPNGAVYGLVGSNGAGKTTILRHLSGVYRQDSGEVCIPTAFEPDEVFDDFGNVISSGLRININVHEGCVNTMRVLREFEIIQ